MRCAVIVFPGSNCDRDMAAALERVTGRKPLLVWHKETALPEVDLVALPGGFSYGDYLRCGAIAARSPIIPAIGQHQRRGGLLLGVCNGFQILTETGLLPGALIRNRGLNFICKTVALRVTSDSIFTAGYGQGSRIALPVAHHDGNFRIDEDGLKTLIDDDRIAFRYADDINGSLHGIAGILSPNRRTLGMMPHPERAVDPDTGNGDGTALFAGLMDGLASA